MSLVGMRGSDGGGVGQATGSGSVIRDPSSSYSFPSFEVPLDSRRKNRRGPLQKNGERDEKGEVEKTFACHHVGCLASFSSKFKLVRHLGIHSGERRFQCTSCGRRFHRKDHLKNHLQVHNPNKILHSCDRCQKTYCSLLSYRKHIALHAAESGDLVCKLCGKMLADREGILQHLKIHTGSRTLRGPSERKFPCERCDRSFFTKKDVKRHLVVHTGKRDFVCPHCPQRFGRKDHLVRHAKKSHSMINGNGTSLENLYKYNAPPSENMKHNAIGPSSLPDTSRLAISSPGSQMAVMDPSAMDVKQDPYSSPPNSIVQPTFTVSHPSENGQSLSRYSEPTMLPMPQYIPMNPNYPTVTPIMPHHYINMSTPSNMLSELLPPMTTAPSFPTTVALDMGNSPLPHFSQAFQ